MKTDKRYTITREWCGASEPLFVVRFCGDWVGSSASRWDAEAIRDHHKAERDKILTGQA
jgi:hypothetical protein